MNTDNRLYRWVKVKSKDDLPTEEGQYHTKQQPYRVYFNPDKEYKQYQDFWVAQQYEYLSPIAETSQEEVSDNLKSFCDARNYIGKPLQTVMPFILEEIHRQFHLIKR